MTQLDETMREAGNMEGTIRLTPPTRPRDVIDRIESLERGMERLEEKRDELLEPILKRAKGLHIARGERDEDGNRSFVPTGNISFTRLKKPDGVEWVTIWGVHRYADGDTTGAQISMPLAYALGDDIDYVYDEDRRRRDVEEVKKAEQRRLAAAREAAERKEYERLKAKFENDGKGA